MLAMLFRQCAGFVTARLAGPGMGGIAFVEFEDIDSATHAKTELQGFKINPTSPLKITYAKQIQ
jgi:hypothetical protein